jgi:carbon monoxide dehydrogenase subunit G
MELDHEFTVPVSADQAWSVLLDVERIAPCMPGATLDSIEGDEFAGRLKVKLGAMTITYKGSARIAARDEAAHKVTIEGQGKESRGSGTASATVEATLHPEGESTRVTVHTKLNVTGRPAQFGRNILSEVGGKLVGRFASALAEEISSPSATPPAAAAEVVDGAAGTPAVSPDGATGAEVPRQRMGDEPGTSPDAVAKPQRRSEDAIDLLEVAGPSVVKRALPLLGGAILALFVARRVFRRRRR